MFVRKNEETRGGKVMNAKQELTQVEIRLKNDDIEALANGGIINIQRENIIIKIQKLFHKKHEQGVNKQIRRLFSMV